MIAAFTIWGIGWLIHLGFALSWCVANKKSAAESWALCFVVPTLWFVFALRMLWRGYDNYITNEWPAGFWE